MYQRKDKKFTWNRFFKITFIIVIMIVSGFYLMLSLFLSNLRNDYELFFDGFEVEPSLIKEQHINDTLLDLRATQIEELIEDYHIPFNMTGEGWDWYPPVSVCWSWSNSSWKFWNNTQLLETFDPLNETSIYTKDNLTYCGDKGHTALYEGVYTAGEAFRYAVAKRNHDQVEMDASLDRIEKLVKAYKLLNEVSDKSAFVRYAIPDTDKAKEMFPGHWEAEDHDVVEYKGFKWSLSRHLSRDVSIGILFGLSMVYKFVDDDDIRDMAGEIIDNAVQYFYDCNWRIVDTDGTQHTSADFSGSRPLMDGGNILTFLQMGKMVDKDKWDPIYHHYAYDRNLAHYIGRSMRIGIDLAPKIYDGYYGCNFVYNNAPSLILLEKDPVLRELYIKNYLNTIHDFAKLHRNANFDIVWLLCHSVLKDDIYDAPKINLKSYDMKIWKNANIEDPEDEDYIIDFCIRDIRDCLMRYAVRRYPNRNYYWATAPGTFPNVHQQEIDLSGYTVPYPEYDYWEPDTEAGDLINMILGGAGREVDDNGLFDNALPCDMRKTEDIMWQRCSFSLDTTERLENNPGNFQVPMGPEYLSVYYMAKYLELF